MTDDQADSETYFTSSASEVEEEEEEDNAKDNAPTPDCATPLKTGEPTLFSSTIKVDKTLSVGTAILASNDNFGDLVVFVNIADKTVLIKEIAGFIFIISQFDNFMCCLINDGSAVADVTYSINYDHTINIAQHPKDIHGASTVITLTTAQMARLKSEHMRTLNTYYEEYKNLTQVTQEAIKDVRTELRMYAQGYCDACKAHGHIMKGHTCVALPGHRLDRVLRSALRVDNKWPSSRGIIQIYKRLAPHTAYFKQEFRNSMRRNQYVIDTYKVAPLPNFVN